MKKSKMFRKSLAVLCMTAVCFCLFRAESIPANDTDENVSEGSKEAYSEDLEENQDEVLNEAFYEDSGENLDEADYFRPIYYKTLHPQLSDVGEFTNGVELDEVYDPTQPIALLDRDDFYTEEEYIEYLNKCDLPCSVMEDLLEYRVAPAPTTTVKAELQYTFSLNVTRAIQSFDIEDGYIYISQVYNNKQTGKKYVRISKCVNTNGVYTEVGSMLLQDAGHGQTLEVYKHNGKTYLLVSCGNYYDSNAKIIWSTQIGRIEFENGKIIQNADVQRLTYLNYSNNVMSKFGATKRVDAAVSTDGSCLLIWKRSRADVDEFSGYDFNMINNIFDNSSSKTIPFKDNYELKRACKFSFGKRENKKNNIPVSIQGLALSNATLDKSQKEVHSIYISSGNEKNNSGNYLYRLNSYGTYRNSVKIDDTGVWSAYGITGNLTAEIEGARISGSEIQFVLRDTAGDNGDNDTIKKRQVIATIPKSILR